MEQFADLGLMATIIAGEVFSRVLPFAMAIAVQLMVHLVLHARISTSRAEPGTRDSYEH
jgi:hypothetical protein